MPMIKIRDTALFVEVVGAGDPIVLMHGGPGLDHWSLEPFRRLSDRHTLVFYDHRCNGQSLGASIETMTWDNLTADADALREHLGFDNWTVIGHSFGGNVALEYVLRYPERVSRLVLLDTGADSRWPRVNAAKVLAERGFAPDKAQLASRWFTGDFDPNEWLSIFSEIGPAYFYQEIDVAQMAQELPVGEGPTFRPEPLLFAGRHLLNGWRLTERLPEINAPTLVMAGRQDFVYPPDAQYELAHGIPGARLRLIDHAGHNPHVEQPDEVFGVLDRFLPAESEAPVLLA